MRERPDRMCINKTRKIPQGFDAPALLSLSHFPAWIIIRFFFFYTIAWSRHVLVFFIPERLDHFNFFFFTSQTALISRAFGVFNAPSKIVVRMHVKPTGWDVRYLRNVSILHVWLVGILNRSHDATWALSSRMLMESYGTRLSTSLTFIITFVWAIDGEDLDIVKADDVFESFTYLQSEQIDSKLSDELWGWRSNLSL